MSKPKQQFQFPNLHGLSLSLGVCATASWPAALQTLQVVQREQCLDTSTYHAAISASTRRWTLALEVLRGMHRVRVQCGLVTLTAAIKRSSQMKRWASALGLLTTLKHNSGFLQLAPKVESSAE